MEWNGTCQLPVYADDVNMLDENIHTIKSIKALLETSREIGLEADKKSKFMVMSHHQNGGQNCNLLIANGYF